MADNERVYKELINRLDLLINVICMSIGEGKSISERARMLKTAGVDNQRIAFVLNTTAKTVSVMTSNLRGPKTKY